jgi:hypothetical protein
MNLLIPVFLRFVRLLILFTRSSGSTRPSEYARHQWLSFSLSIYLLALKALGNLYMLPDFAVCFITYTVIVRCIGSILLLCSLLDLLFISKYELA